ncbi:hypothetical protein [Actibacterium sp. XHP0104]|uniref:hypothetical protein n=1 Tax=Actibacterium sp. XHP0104 TaxID=2984335 RepID=UPI0021E978E8|nr:hypothetical protein [Actibacterium sp. XHP0104]MCV2882613.1 hypothetical protein [Actibacterium sp. XHP0104]
MYDHPISSAPNYTRPALVMALVNLISLFFVVWALFGFGHALILGVVLNLILDNWGARRARRD